MQNRWILVGSIVAVALMALAAGLTWAQGPAPQGDAGVQAALGTAFTYQGQLKKDGNPISDTCDFKFSLWSAASGGTQVGTTQTKTGVSVSNGLFTIPDLDFGANAFQGQARWLQIAVRCPAGSGSYTTLSPRQPLTAVPYALYSKTAPWSGITGTPDFREKFANVVVVAKSGGDFTSIQDAIDSITDASADNPYLVWVAPGRYEEHVRMKPYVHIQGAGQDATIIAGSSVSRTLILTSYVTLRDLTVQNPCTPGSTAGVTAIRAQAGTTGTLVSNVKVWSSNEFGSCDATWGIAIRGPDTSVTLQDVTALAEGGSELNHGLWVFEGASVTIRGGSFTARGGDYAYGIYVTAMLQPGAFVGADGTYAFASGATINYGFYNQNSVSAFLQGGYFRASGGDFAYGIRNDNGATLEAEGITALGEKGDSSYGFYNESASATLRGGSFVALGSGGSTAIAVENRGGTIEAHDLSAQAEGASTVNYAWKGEVLGSEQRIYGGTFIGRGGSSACGISVLGTGSIQGVYAVGENGSSAAVGLYVTSSGTVDAHDSRFKGNPAVNTYGTLKLALSQVDGGITKNAGTVTCYQVYDENYNAYTCP